MGEMTRSCRVPLQRSHSPAFTTPSMVPTSQLNSQQLKQPEQLRMRSPLPSPRSSFFPSRHPVNTPLASLPASKTEEALYVLQPGETEVSSRSSKVPLPFSRLEVGEKPRRTKRKTRPSAASMSTSGCLSPARASLGIPMLISCIGFPVSRFRLQHAGSQGRRGQRGPPSRCRAVRQLLR